MSTRIELSELETYLYASADILRGHVEASDYKSFVFPLLFFKRICDVYDEEITNAIKEYGEDGAQFMGNTIHKFVIPEGHHWRDVRNCTENVGIAIKNAFHAIEQLNEDPKTHEKLLLGVFGDAPWANKAALPDETLKNLIEHFSTKSLTIANCPEDELGQAYEYLIKKFGDDSGHTSQEFYTNRTVVHLMTEILKPEPGESVYDPTCGSAGMLISCIHYLRERGAEWRGMKCYGQEINPLSAAIGKMNLFLNGVLNFKIVNADTLKYPAFIEGGQLKQFDVVLANPPYSISSWDRDAFETDQYGRNMYGVPPQSRADYAFIQHIIASLSENGRCAILLPHGVLNRKEEADIRKKIVEADLIETVIGLGRHLFYNSGLESCILICNRNKKPDQKGRIRFIEAERYQYKEKGQSYLSENDISIIANAYHSSTDIPELLKIVSNEDVLGNDGNLNIKLYVSPDENNKSTDVFVQETLDGISTSLSNSDDVWNSVCTIFPEVMRPRIGTMSDVKFPDWELEKWSKVKLSEIATEYSERIDNPSESNYEWYIGSDCIDGFDYRIARKTPASKITSAQKVFKEGDYLLVRRSLYGSDFRERAPRATFDGVCSADILTIREIPGKVYDGYLIAVLYSKALWNFIVSNATGSLTRRIKWSQLKDFEIMLPPMHIQEKIAKMLWALYDLKSSYQGLLDKTDELVKSQFIELFGDPVSKVKDTLLTELGSVCSLKAGKFIKADEIAEQPFENCYPCYGGNGIRGYVNTNNQSGEHPLIGRQGALCGNVQYVTGEFYATEHAVVVTPNDNTQFDCFWLFHLLLQLKLERYATGAAQPGIAVNKLERIRIAIPDVDEQKKFSAFAKQSDKSKYVAFQETFSLDNIVKYKLQSLFQEELICSLKM